MAAVSSIILYFTLLLTPVGTVLRDTSLAEDYAIGEFQRATRVVVSAQGMCSSLMLNKIEFLDLSISQIRQ